MQRISDILVILLCCLPAAALCNTDAEALTRLAAAMLVAVACACIAQIVRGRWMLLPPAVYCAAALFIPEFIVFLPLAVACLQRGEWVAARFVWVVPLAVALASLETLQWAACCLVCVAAFLLARRSEKALLEIAELSALRDQLHESSLSLESRSRDLQDRQDFEVRLATLNERGRIAREIHDNVGHLLTRAIMQVEALQVVHADDVQVAEEFSQVGDTLHAAMDTVRASVHDLHDDSLDLRRALLDTLEGCGIEHTSLDYHAEHVPTPVAYCLNAIVRESLSNTSKHSNASHVYVDVVEHPGLFQLSVRDDGTQAPQAFGTGIGLQTMEDRVRALGGVFRTGYDKGFRVTASIPKAPADAASARPAPTASAEGVNP